MRLSGDFKELVLGPAEEIRERTPLENGGVREVNKQGRIRYFDRYGDLHRTDGPAEIYPNGIQRWYQNGLQHRNDGGPADINPITRTEKWYYQGRLHRTDGPAIIEKPANIRSKERRLWFINNGYLTKDVPPRFGDNVPDADDEL